MTDLGALGGCNRHGGGRHLGRQEGGRLIGGGGWLIGGLKPQGSKVDTLKGRQDGYLVYFQTILLFYLVYFNFNFFFFYKPPVFIYLYSNYK